MGLNATLDGSAWRPPLSSEQEAEARLVPRAHTKLVLSGVLNRTMECGTRLELRDRFGDGPRLRCTKCWEWVRWEESRISGYK